MGLTLGLSHEKDIWKRDASSQWWDRIVLRDVHGGTVGPKLPDEKKNCGRGNSCEATSGCPDPFWHSRHFGSRLLAQ